jgi:hypothetical protein
MVIVKLRHTKQNLKVAIVFDDYDQLNPKLLEFVKISRNPFMSR